MSKPVSPSAALPIAHAVLRILIVVNWAGAAAIAVLLFAMPTSEWIQRAFGIGPSPDTSRLIAGLCTIAAIGIIAAPLNHIVLKRLLAMVDTVRSGDPFVAANADRLQAIAWSLVALQCLSLIVGLIAKAISTPAHPLHFNAGFSITGWLTVLLTFLLARVFAEGTLMREDLAGTV